MNNYVKVKTKLKWVIVNCIVYDKDLEYFAYTIAVL